MNLYMNMPDLSTVQTPFYLYDLDLLDETIKSAVAEADRFGFHIHYATKANYDRRILRRMLKAGIGIDCVSGNEMTFALEQGFNSHGIVLAGVGKTDREIEDALHCRIRCMNVESLEELEVVAELASKLRIPAPVALRVNPDIEALTHHYISTGSKEHKFGISMKRLQDALDICDHHPWINLLGFHFHIGSQITSLQPFEQLCVSATRLWNEHNMTARGCSMINLGGGFGVDYENPCGHPVPDFSAFFNIFAENLRIPASVERHFELGRSLVAQCGSLITRVLYMKKGDVKTHVIVDAGMTELIRPALYGSVHHIENMSSELYPHTYDVVGPVCESSDFLGLGVALAETHRNDLLKIHTCGAYAESMAMRYNMRGPIGKVYLENDGNLRYKSNNMCECDRSVEAGAMPCNI
jgi:diaminopimelate decarboxylase